MNRFTRILKHRLVDDTDTRRALDSAALERLAQRVRQSEARHSGEIRLSVEAGLPLSYLWQGLGARDRAVTLFGKLRVWDTEANNGVLIYLLLAEHAIEIVADRGLARHVPPAHWQAVVAGMREAFRAGQFEAGLMQAIDAVEALLLQHFPLAEGERNPNELPDGVDLR
ncbi:MAG: TPM domain-containing protein [Rubrivivax sp.]|nr:TPM domain-containing protein [Rubrivivax sp.]